MGYSISFYAPCLLVPTLSECGSWDLAPTPVRLRIIAKCPDKSVEVLHGVEAEIMDADIQLIHIQLQAAAAGQR